MRSIIVGKIGGLLLVAVLLLVGLAQITDVVHERQMQHMNAVTSVAQSLAGSQTVLGPLVHRDCTEEWTISGDKGPVPQSRAFSRTAAPTTLKLAGTSLVEARARGLHATQVFTLKGHLVAQWQDLKTLESAREHADSKLQCGSPLLMLAVSDARGIRQANVLINGVAQTLHAGTGHTVYSRGVQTNLPANIDLGVPLSADIDLELVGTESLNFVPLGGATQISLTSNWPHPSFGGQFLPSERQVGDKGFESSWRVSALASSAQQAVLRREPLCAGGSAPDMATSGNGCVEVLGVGFMDPINTYSLSDRATKYGLLFIALTFVAVGLFEFMRGLRVHPIQYFLVGAALSIFFLLLVSLSEHLPFAASYAVAASACVLLLGYYASHMLHSWKRGLPFAGGIATLYALLYVLLQLEQTAMVVGSIALFAVLALVMLLTRKVDWYARLQIA
jgi:inner membrane protein